jgi:hypothetical protein
VFAGNAPGLQPSPVKLAGAGGAGGAEGSGGSSAEADPAMQDIDARLENLQAFLKSARG